MPLCLWFQLQIQWGRGWERCWCYLWLLGVPDLLRLRDKFACYTFWKGNLSLANLPSAFKILGALDMSCSEASLEMLPLSFTAHFWKRKAWVSQSHEAHCWKVGILPLIALRRRREGRWLQYVVVGFVLKDVSLFSWWQERGEYCKTGKLGLQMF